MNSFKRIIEKEKVSQSENIPYIKNFEACLIKEGEFSISILKQKKEDEQRHKELKKAIENMKKEIHDNTTVIADLKNEINELKTQHKQVEEMIKDSNAQNVKSNGTENITDILRKTHRFIKHKLRLYEDYLGCTITFQEPDTYVFSFSNYDNFTATVKFQFNDDSNWTVLDYEPKDLLAYDLVWLRKTFDLIPK